LSTEPEDIIGSERRQNNAPLHWDSPVHIGHAKVDVGSGRDGVGLAHDLPRLLIEFGASSVVLLHDR
jgi:hypothetical protein